MVEVAGQCLAILNTAGLDATIINARCVKPLDDRMLSSLIGDHTLKMVTMEEGYLAGGFGTAVLEWAATNRMRHPGGRQAEIACLGLPDGFVNHGSRKILMDKNGLSPEKSAEFILNFWRGGGT